MSKITTKGIEDSVPLVGIATAVISLSDGKVITVTNPIGQIIDIFRFVENPKNRFFNIGGMMVNISQIVSMQWVDESPCKRKK